MKKTIQKTVRELESLCKELEQTVREHNGMTHHAEQTEWGIAAYHTGRGIWILRDCDGEVWASGGAAEVLAQRDSLKAQLAKLTDECHCDDETDRE